MDMRPSWATGMRPGTLAVRHGLPTPGRGDRLPDGLVRRVWDEFARPYWKRLVAFLVAILSSSGLAVLPPVLFGALIDHGVLQQDFRMVTLLALAAVAVAVAAAGASLLQRWLSAWIGERLIFDLRRRLFDHVQRMPIAFFTRTQTGALISRMNNDVIGAQQAVTGTFGSVAANVVRLAAALVVMLSMEWRLTLLVLTVLPLFVIPARRVGERLQGLTREGMELNAGMNSRMTERFNVAGAMLVKLFGRYDEETDEFAGRAERVADIGVKQALVGRVFFVTLAFVGAVGVAIVYWVGGRLAITSPGFSPGNVVAFAGLVTMAYNPLSALTNARVEIMTALVSFDRVFEILDVAHPIADRATAVALERPRGRIAFEDVWFSYPARGANAIASLEEVAEVVPPATGGAAGDGPPVLRGVSLVAEPGTMTALVGPSGAGKTTLSHLVARLYDVTSGAVRIDGRDVREVERQLLVQAPTAAADPLMKPLRVSSTAMLPPGSNGQPGWISVAGAPDVTFFNPKTGLVHIAIGKPGLVQSIDPRTGTSTRLMTGARAHTTALAPPDRLYVFAPEQGAALVLADT
jgi:ATP-binding cassette, subfamily B, bacterial